MRFTGLPKTVVTSSWAGLAANPDLLITGELTRDGNGAVTAADVLWPDGDEGAFTGTPSTTFLTVLDEWTVTKVTDSGTVTFTQPEVTRDAAGNVIDRPAIEVS